MSKKKLRNKIKKVRVALYNFAKEKDLTDPEVVRMSQRLDRLLNKY